MNGIFKASVLSIGLLLGAELDQEAVLKEIDRLYKVAKNRQDLLKIETLTHEATRRFPEADAVSWRLGRTHFKLGKWSEAKADKIRYFSLCLEHAQNTVRINPKSANGFFFKGLCNGKLGQTRGMWASLGIIEPLKKSMEIAIRLDPSVSEGGPHRALGNLYLQLPRFFGKDLKRSINHFREAVRLGPKYGENHLGLARAYFENDDYVAARDTLRAFLEVASKLGEDESVRNLISETHTLLHQIAERIGP